jgi:hypothetical protein
MPAAKINATIVRQKLILGNNRLAVVSRVVIPVVVMA